MTTFQDEELVEVKFLDLPIDVRKVSTAHHDELFREFRLILTGNDHAAHEVPGRLLRLIRQLESQYSGVSATVDRDIAMAEVAGDETVSTSMRAPRSARDAAESLLRLLDEADEYCRNGDLLTLAPPVGALRYREWYLGEIIRQIDGQAPIPWGSFVTASA